MGAGWRREVVGREIVVLVLKQILLLLLQIFLFIKILVLLFVFQEKLVFQIKFILPTIKIIQLSGISICGSSSVQPLLLLWGKPVGGALLYKEKLLFVAEANRGKGSAQQESDQVGNQVLFPLRP